jgi:5-methylcytosine-specific restriction endonuclease McrA
MKEITLLCGNFALVDDEDYSRVSVHKWRIKKYRNYLYVVMCQTRPTTLLRFISEQSDPDIRVIPKDGNHLNCTRSNIQETHFKELKYSIDKKPCFVVGCPEYNNGPRQCNHKYSDQPDYKMRQAKIAAVAAKKPKRKQQKRKAQAKYHVSDKAALAQLRRWSKHYNKPVLITDTEYITLRKQPCHKCGKPSNPIGLHFMLKDPNGDMSLDNILPSCGRCRLINPKEKFDYVKFSKSAMRHYWRRTPMVALAIQKSRVGAGLFKCAKCKNIFKKGEIDVDHVTPIADLGNENLDIFARHLFCDDELLQILCKECHTDKTVFENNQRHLNKELKLLDNLENCQDLILIKKKLKKYTARCLAQLHYPDYFVKRVIDLQRRSSTCES